MPCSTAAHGRTAGNGWRICTASWTTPSRCHDEGRVARARAELGFIAGELASAFGLGGRGRQAGSPIERARKAVASRIRFSLTHIARVHPAMARHLRRYIRTGTVCTYVVPDEPVRWSV